MGSRRLYHVALQALVEKLWERGGRRCALCSGPMELKELTSAHIDHIVPRSLGGKDDMDNLQAAHYLCNIRKGNGIPWVDRHPKIEMPCQECGALFTGLKGVSRYCTPAHQNAAAARRHRERRRTSPGPPSGGARGGGEGES